MHPTTAIPNDLGPQCLIQAARGGSREALGELLDTFRNYCLLMAGRELDPQLRAKGGASDLVQETFLKAHVDFEQFRGDTPGELLAWLRRILLHTASNFTRHYRGTGKRQVGQEVSLNRSGPVGRLSLAASGPTPGEEALRRERVQQLERALEQLPEPYREVVLLRQRDNLPFEEVGQRTGRSADAARKLWLRAIAQLKQDLTGTHGP